MPEIGTLRSTWRRLETWHGRDIVTLADEKGEPTGNTNIDLNRRASLRPYQPLSKAGKGLGKLEPQGAGLLAARINSPHAPKAL
jgi:hypothetical protein